MSAIEDILAPAKNVVVSAPEPKPATYVRPAHHLNNSQTRFMNPWPSFRPPTPGQFFKFMFQMLGSSPAIPKNITTLIPAQKPTWGAEFGKEDVKATWLGHACLLVELPAQKDAVRGPRVIFDPALSESCSPIQFAGPKRYTPMPCEIEDIPTVDAIVLSHNHYDHTDTHSLQTLFNRHKAHVFAPLGNQPYLSSIGIPASHLHILDWWDDRTVSLSIPTASTSSTLPEKPIHAGSKFKITCTPAQHTSNRTPFDRCNTLWASWAVEEVLEGNAGVSRQAKKVYFAGDTGYRTIRDGESPEQMPVCPAFKEIGDKIGPFDLAMIPIGAYQPRTLFSCYHAHPADSIGIFKDVRAKKALAMHWGTWILTPEPLMEPVDELRKERENAKIPQADFDICALGETRQF